MMNDLFENINDFEVRDEDFEFSSILHGGYTLTE